MSIARKLKRLTERTPKRALLDSKGSFIRGRDGNWWVGFDVPLATAFDWLAPSEANDTHERHLALLRALEGLEAQIEVLTLPVSLEERVRRIMAAEDSAARRPSDTGWVARRTAEAVRLANRLARRKGGDVETVGLLFVNLGRSFEQSLLTQSQFAVRPLPERFYLEYLEHAGKLSEAESVMTRLEAAWPSMTPVRPEVLDKALMQMVWPGHTEAEPLIGVETETGKYDLNLEYFGQSDYTDTKPYLVEVDYYGTKKYVACLPIRTPDIFPLYESNRGREFAFQAYAGRRVRFSWRFNVTGGKQEIIEAGNRLSDVVHHAQSHVDAGGFGVDHTSNITLAKANYEHLHADGLVVKGRPMLIVAADTENELAKMRETLRQAVRKGGCQLVDDNQIQRRLLVASFPGAKPLDRYIRTMGPKVAAAAMPFVTSDPGLNGSDLFGFTMGKEVYPVLYSLGTPLRAGMTVAPVYCLFGPSRRGKTTGLIDWLIPMAMRGYVTHIYDLAKFDVGLLDGNQLPPGLSVSFLDLLEHPGCLNPVLLTPVTDDPETRDELRVAAMANHLRKMCGRKWRDEWSKALRGACAYVLQDAYRTSQLPADEVIPSLYQVRERLRSKRGGFEFEDDLEACLSEPMSDRETADISCANNSARQLLDELASPGLHVIQQRGLSLPDATLDEGDYEPRHNLALATLDLAGLLSYTVAMARDVRVAIGHVEYHVTSRLSRGANVAEFLARVGAALTTITLYDTQYATDLADKLKKQVTGWCGFAPDNPEAAAEDLRHMGFEVSAGRVHAFNDLKNPAWTAGSTPDGITKGGILFRPPTARGKLVALQVARHYVGTAFLTDQSEREGLQQPAASVSSAQPQLARSS